MSESDQVLIGEILNGKSGSFDMLMQRYEKMVFKVAYYYTHDEDQALDVSQEVFLKAYRHLNRFRGESQLKTWLTRIAVNESQNWVKKHRRHLPTDDILQFADRETGDTQEDEMLASENRVQLLRSLYQLNTRYRLAVILRYFENYSIREIAATMKCSEGVVKNMLFRSLQKLKKNLPGIESGV